jgi:predicted nucleic acid-binding protein
VKRLFLDANVLFTAAHNPSGKASLALELGTRGHWRMVTSTLAAEEARRNLASKFPDALSRLAQLLRDIKMLPSVSGRVCPIHLPAKDQPIFLTALSCGATHLLTGDMRHFGSFMNDASKTAGMRITTVAAFFVEE